MIYGIENNNIIKKFDNVTESKKFINSMYGSIIDETFTAPDDWPKSYSDE